MKNLYSKYINNQLTVAELEELRKDNPQKFSSEMEEALNEEWNADEDYSQIPDDVVAGIKSRLDKAIIRNVV